MSQKDKTKFHKKKGKGTKRFGKRGDKYERKGDQRRNKYEAKGDTYSSFTSLEYYNTKIREYVYGNCYEAPNAEVLMFFADSNG